MDEPTPPELDLPGLEPGRGPVPLERARRRASLSFLIGLLLLAFLVVSAARQTKPGPRLSRKGRLVDLITLEQQRTASLRRELADLQTRLTALEGDAARRESRVAAIRADASLLEPFAGLAAVRGPGVVVTLRDSTLRESPTGDPNDLVIHQQDIQAVVNALWDGGAEAISINGERITALTAVRCVGNTLLLHGSVYSPPYVVAAVGSASTIGDAFDRSDGVQQLRILSDKFKLGFSMARKGQMTLGAFLTRVPLRFAQPGAASRTRR